jgi:hypothetical protein
MDDADKIAAHRVAIDGLPQPRSEIVTRFADGRRI